MTAWYLDSSAIVKSTLEEPESLALEAWRLALGGGDVLVTCELAVAEVIRAVARAGGDVDDAMAQLDALDHFVVDRDLLLAAGALRPTLLRTLDAVHLAAAMTFGAELGAVVTYDERMAAAAGDLGVAALAPGR